MLKVLSLLGIVLILLGSYLAYVGITQKTLTMTCSHQTRQCITTDLGVLGRFETPASFNLADLKQVHIAEHHYRTKRGDSISHTLEGVLAGSGQTVTIEHDGRLTLPETLVLFQRFLQDPTSKPYTAVRDNPHYLYWGIGVIIIGFLPVILYCR